MGPLTEGRFKSVQKRRKFTQAATVEQTWEYGARLKSKKFNDQKSSRI